MPRVGRLMDRRRSARLAEYRSATYCETHRCRLAECYATMKADRLAACMVCGCGGLCDSREPCPMQCRPMWV